MLVAAVSSEELALMKISAALAVASCALAISVNAAKADPIPYVVTIEQVGSNIVATGGGDFDLTGLTLLSHSGTQTAGAVKPSAPGAGIALSTSPPPLDVYSGISGPTNQYLWHRIYLRQFSRLSRPEHPTQH